jgi:hypothetical protein
MPRLTAFCRSDPSDRFIDLANRDLYRRAPVARQILIALFDRFQAKWSGLDRHTATGLGEDNAFFFLITGEFHADSEPDRNAFLAALGGALVFLIDWTKARKLLRSWVAKEDAARILDWAARHHLGHRAFLELGGKELIGAAARNAVPSRIGFGKRGWIRRSDAAQRSTSSRP